MEGSFLYIIHTRECRRLNEDVYKIGRSEQCVTRVRSYGRGALVYLLVPVEDSKGAEKKVIQEFKKHFVQKKYYGTEYFEGNLREMQNIMLTVSQYSFPVVNKNLEDTETEDEDESEGILDESKSEDILDESEIEETQDLDIRKNAAEVKHDYRFFELTDYILYYFKENQYSRMSDKSIRNDENKFLNGADFLKMLKTNAPSEIERPLRKESLFKLCVKFIANDEIIPAGELPVEEMPKNEDQPIYKFLRENKYFNFDEKAQLNWK